MVIQYYYWKINTALTQNSQAVNTGASPEWFPCDPSEESVGCAESGEPKL